LKKAKKKEKNALKMSLTPSTAFGLYISTLHIQIKLLRNKRKCVLSVPLEVQGLISQELPTQAKEHREKSEKKRMSRKFNKRKSFSQVEMTFNPILA